MADARLYKQLEKNPDFKILLQAHYQKLSLQSIKFGQFTKTAKEH